MRLLVAAVALVAAGCGTSTDQALTEQLDTIAGEGCDAVGWEATADATSKLPEASRIHSLTTDEAEAACGFGMHAWQRTEEQASETSPVAVIVVSRRTSNDPPPLASDLVAHTAKQWVSGAGQAEASSRLIYPRHILVVAINKEYVGELQPERLLRAAKDDLGA